MAFYNPLLTLHWKPSAVKIVNANRNAARSSNVKRAAGKGKAARVRGKGGRSIRRSR